MVLSFKWELYARKVVHARKLYLPVPDVLKTPAKTWTDSRFHKIQWNHSGWCHATQHIHYVGCTYGQCRQFSGCRHFYYTLACANRVFVVATYVYNLLLLLAGSTALLFHILLLPLLLLLFPLLVLFVKLRDEVGTIKVLQWLPRVLRATTKQSLHNCAS